MLATVFCEVVNTKRTEYGTLKLKGLKRGSHRELTENEIDSLKELCKKNAKLFSIKSPQK